MSNPNIINGDTSVSISVLIGTFPVLLALILVWLRIGWMAKKLKNVWTVPHQRVFAERLESHNHDKALKVPDVDGVLATFNGGTYRKEQT